MLVIALENEEGTSYIGGVSKVTLKKKGAARYSQVTLQGVAVGDVEPGFSVAVYTETGKKLHQLIVTTKES